MKKKLNENAILQRMTREETQGVIGGDDTGLQGLLCMPTHKVCECLLAGCGCTPVYQNICRYPSQCGVAVTGDSTKF